jgi:hypothetical protein
MPCSLGFVSQDIDIKYFGGYLQTSVGSQHAQKECLHLPGVALLLREWVISPFETLPAMETVKG